MSDKMSREQLEAAFAELSSTAKWILENPRIHPENIRSQMKILAKKFNIDYDHSEPDMGCFVLTTGNN